jgi:nitrogen fixation protein NifU and related proteins
MPKYSEKIMDHYENPRNVGSFDANEKNIYTGLVGATSCGDVIKLQLKINEQEIIEEAKFKAFGCASAIASASLATELVKNKTITEAMKIKNTDVVKFLSLPPIKIHCSILIEEVIKKVIDKFKMRNKCQT